VAPAWGLFKDLSAGLHIPRAPRWQRAHDRLPLGIIHRSPAHDLVERACATGPTAGCGIDGADVDAQGEGMARRKSIRRSLFALEFR
jgi:hypothetical protein